VEAANDEENVRVKPAYRKIFTNGVYQI